MICSCVTFATGVIPIGHTRYIEMQIFVQCVLFEYVLHDVNRSDFLSRLNLFSLGSTVHLVDVVVGS